MGKQTFSTAGSDTFNVPAGVSSVTVKIWGAGAGGAGGGTSGVGGAGGGGGYTQGDIAVTALETLSIHVGGAGGLGSFPGTSGSGGGGAGKSSVYRSTVPLFVAAGGGGGGGGDNSSATAGGAGGAGGGTTGGSGGNSSSAVGATGGTQSISGTGGTGGDNLGEIGKGPAATTFNNALNFDGDPEYVDLGNDSVFAFTNAFTLECWIKPTGSVNRRVMGSRPSGTSNGVGFGISGANAITFSVFGEQDYISTTTVTNGVWTHIAVVFTSSNNARFYKNGIFAEQINGASAAHTTNINMTLGQNGSDGQYYQGELDEVKMWSDERTDKEISDYYAQSLTGSETNLVAYYKCNESSGTNLPDETTNNNDGTLQNMEDADWVTSSWSPLTDAANAGGGGEGADGDSSESTKGGQSNGGTTYGGDGGTGDVSPGFGGGGGGGAGYGGGGGGCGSLTTDAGGSGGGGGSNYIINTATSTTDTQASGQNPPNSGDPDYTGGVGVGGNGGATSTSGSNGNDGLIVIIWGVEHALALGLALNSDSSQNLESVSDFTPPSSSSVLFWLVLSQTNQFSYMVSRSTTWYVGMEDDGGSPSNSVVNFLNDGTALYSNTSLQSNTLYHIACTASDSARQIFINGEVDSTAVSGGSPPSVGALYVGSTAVPDNFFSGKLEDVRIYDRVLSDAEVQTIYASRGLDGITYGLLDKWPLNELPIGRSYVSDTTFGIITTGSTDTDTNWTRMMGGDFPDVSGMKLISVSIYISGTHTSQARVAVYQGGTTTLPTGASLIEDLGQTIGSGTNQWLTLNSSTNPSLTGNTPTWIALKGGTGFAPRYQTTATGDFYSAHGRTDVGAMGSDPTVSYPSTVPSGGANSAFWYSYYLTYGDGSGTGQVKDMGINQINLTPNNAPVYSGSQLMYRRKYRTH